MGESSRTEIIGATHEHGGFKFSKLVEFRDSFKKLSAARKIVILNLFLEGLGVG